MYFKTGSITAQPTSTIVFNEKHGTKALQLSLQLYILKKRSSIIKEEKLKRICFQLVPGGTAIMSNYGANFHLSPQSNSCYFGSDSDTSLYMAMSSWSTDKLNYLVQSLLWFCKIETENIAFNALALA